MAEYLSPGVYVEEVELGPRPVEGVSTSTAGTVGVAERGPEDVPVLLTSFPDYQRIFGGYLDPRTHPDTWYLPLATEGFFQNGGQRVYTVRVASPGAQTAAVQLMAAGAPTAYASALEARVQAGDRYLLVSDVAALAGSETLRIDDGAATEYVTAGATFPVTADRVTTLRAPTYASYAGPNGALGTDVLQVPAIAPDPVVYSETLAAVVTSASSTIRVSATTGLNPGDVLRIADVADPNADEYVIVEMVPALPSDTTVTLRHPLAFDHALAATVDRMAENAPGAATNLSQAVSAGSSLLVLDDASLIAAGDVVRIGGDPNVDDNSSYAVVADLQVLGIDAPAADEHPVGDRVAVLAFVANPGTNGTLTADVDAGDDLIRLVPGNLVEGDWVQVGGATPEFAQIADIPADPTAGVRLRQPLRNDHLAADAVVRQTRSAGQPYTRLLQHLHAGTTTVLLADGAPDFDVAGFVEIGEPDSPGREYRVLGPQGSLAVLPLAGSFPAQAHRAGRLVLLRAALFAIVALDRGAWGNGLRAAVEEEDPPVVQTTTPGAGPMSNVSLASTSGVEPGTLLEFLAFATSLEAPAAAGADAIEVADASGIGAGDRLRIGRAYPEYVTVAGPPVAEVVTLTAPLRRAHDRRAPVDLMDATGLPVMAKVIDRAGASAVSLEGGGLPGALAPGTVVRSREFRLSISWVKPNPRRPSEEIVVAAEVHRHLTLDDRHSRYAARVIGSVNGPIRLWDRRPDGESELVRIDDPLDSQQSQTSIRPAPDLIFDVLPSGRGRAVGRPLLGGDDDNAGVDDNAYRGVDNIDPLLRTGLQSLHNEESLSLVAIPGRTSDELQGEVITHCELERYRFALLDSIPGTAVTGAQLPEVQVQRQRYDSKYAALYYPWLMRENPFPQGGGATNLAIPPSGHMLGVYARTDVTRGVHKAPANEVVRGIRGFQRALTKGEHDVLNPSPTNINVLRDFREQNRGLRVWGARVITSDPAWRYVNVRRLFNYVERSLELGTQWVVFEPNDHNLWAQVRRSISDFLLLVWRSGGLMGQTAEEAYFVKCDETTMTQADIDAGRLIVVVGIAPTKPAEFVVIRIGQWAGGSFLDEG